MVDGYNAIRRVPEWNRIFTRDMGLARNALVRYCGEWRARHRDFREVIVVFDGDSSVPPQPRAARPGVRVVFTRTGEEADQRILALIQQARSVDRIVVVSDDAEIARGARVHGAEAISVQEFGTASGPRRDRPGRATEDKTRLSGAQKKEINDMLKRAYGLD